MSPGRRPRRGTSRTGRVRGCLAQRSWSSTTRLTGSPLSSTSSTIGTAGSTTSAAPATPAQAIACFEELVAAETEIAVLLVALPLLSAEGSGLLDEARRLHPHSKRALVISWNDTGNRVIGDAIFDAFASGRIDHYMLQPAGHPDELFHHSVSGLLLDWTETQRTSPFTVHVVGESWSGRAYELRNALGRCAMPHVFWLADSEHGQALVARAGPDCELPLVVLPDGTMLHDPSNAELAAATGSAVSPERGDFDLVIVGAGPAGLSAAVVRRLGGLQHAGRRRRRHRRSGHLELAHPQLPGLPARRERSTARARAPTRRPGCSAPASC